VVEPLLCGGGGSGGEGGRGGAVRRCGIEDGGGRLTDIGDTAAASPRRSRGGGPSFFCTHTSFIIEASAYTKHKYDIKIS
jgi:hypothetical protein